MLSGGSKKKASMFSLAGNEYWLGWKSMGSPWRGWDEWKGWSEESSATSSSEKGAFGNPSKGIGGFGHQPSYMDLENPEQRGIPTIPTVSAEESGEDSGYPRQQ